MPPKFYDNEYLAQTVASSQNLKQSRRFCPQVSDVCHINCVCFHAAEHVQDMATQQWTVINFKCTHLLCGTPE